MKFPSLFRTPGHQRFNVTPRYYDPVKEDLDARISQIKAEMSAENGEEIDEEFSKMTGSRISGSFARRNARKGPINLMQVVILALLIGLIAGYWYFGNLGLYVIITISSVLLYLKIKRII
ncbi:MAG: hypothetical protein P8X57_02775 [Cyclobacteriaceae bacterium]